MVNVAYYVPNSGIIQSDIFLATVKKAIQQCSVKYIERLPKHLNAWANLLRVNNEIRRLRRYEPVNLAHAVR